MSTDFPSRWAPDEGLTASMRRSSQGEDVDERGLTELLIRSARDRFKYRRGEPQDTEEQ